MPSEHRSVYQTALAATAKTIRKRAWWYRNLVVSVAVVLVGSTLTALVLRSAQPLLACVAIVPLFAVFLLVDARLVIGWQAQMLDLWVNEQLELTSLRDALVAMPAIPPRTLNGMLALLPIPETTSREIRSAAARRAVARLSREIQVALVVRSTLGATIRLVIISGAVLAILNSSTRPLLTAFAISLVLGIAGSFVVHRLRRRRGELERLLQEGAAVQHLPTTNQHV
jgi:hypothetical protein